MRSIIFSVLSCAAVFSTNGYAQDFSYSNVSISSVTFSGGNLNIRKDDATGNYTAPHWSSSALPKPVAYVSGNAPQVSAVFTIDCSNVPDSVMLRGSGSDGIDFAELTVAVGPSGSSVHPINYPATIGSHVFAPGIVRFFKPFDINWEISLDNGVTWKTIGTSSNTLYVMRSAPMAETTNFKYWHSVYDISCRNAQFKSADTAIISSIWNEFTDQIVLNFNDDSLHYYKPMNTTNTTLTTLLQYKNAQCYTYAQLFCATLKIQGVVRTNNYVYITPIGNSVCGYSVNRFVVKNWIFGTPSASAECALFPYKNTYTGTTIPAPYTAYVFTTADVNDAGGIPGSCSLNPSSYFNNHQIVKLDGKYYDPCYGVMFNSLGDIKNVAFDGWSFRYTTWSGVTNAYFTNDMSQSDLDETITTW